MDIFTLTSTKLSKGNSRLYFEGPNYNFTECHNKSFYHHTTAVTFQSLCWFGTKSSTQFNSNQKCNQKFSQTCFSDNSAIQFQLKHLIWMNFSYKFINFNHRRKFNKETIAHIFQSNVWNVFVLILRGFLKFEGNVKYC